MKLLKVAIVPTNGTAYAGYVMEGCSCTHRSPGEKRGKVFFSYDEEAGCHRLCTTQGMRGFIMFGTSRAEYVNVRDFVDHNPDGSILLNDRAVGMVEIRGQLTILFRFEEAVKIER
ncbi:MAG: hypothetical protein WC766_05545 [Patescibacteria group bacterium]|jgi:hypothetical protein